jgi:hypothetical protein
MTRQHSGRIGCQESLELLRKINQGRATGAETRGDLKRLRYQDCQRSQQMREYWVKEQLPRLPLLGGYEWRVGFDLRGELRLELHHGPRLMGAVFWSSRAQHWQAMQHAPAYPRAQPLPQFFAHGATRIVLWEGPLEQCAAELLRACERPDILTQSAPGDDPGDYMGASAQS